MSSKKTKTKKISKLQREKAARYYELAGFFRELGRLTLEFCDDESLKDWIARKPKRKK